jgi:hypothetical protein
MAILNLFSHPAFQVAGNYTLVGYNLFKSAANGDGSPNPYGPWTAVSGYNSGSTTSAGYLNNTNIVDTDGSYFDLYRVAPVITVTPENGSPVTTSLPQSRPFYAWQSLFDMSISQLIDHFRRNWLTDTGVDVTESTIPTETSGATVMPFVTDPNTTRMFLSFLPNDDPIKLIADNVQVYLGATKSAASMLTPYSDYYPSEAGGYIDFQTAPPSNYYLQVQYTKVKYTNDDCRSALLNAVSSLSLYGINGYGVAVSNNLYYLGANIPNRDLGDMICQIAYRNLLNADFKDSLEGAESWKDGKDGVEWTADPSRALQAAQGRIADLETDLRRRATAYILNTRKYTSRGEFDSFFDVSGVLPVYSLIVAGANIGGAIGWWL